MSNKLKKLTGKNPKDFEPVAYSLINDSDTGLFKELVEHDDYLFDFVKENVSRRLEKNVNKNNVNNLLAFLKYYSPFYEDFIVNSLVNFGSSNITDKMLNIFTNGTEDEKTYCAKFFSIVKNPIALHLLRENTMSENPNLSTNCVTALAALDDREIFEQAMQKLNSDDDFEQLDAVKILVSYGDKSAASPIIEVMKYSSMAENIASELPYLLPLFEMEQNDKLFVLNIIIEGLGEIINLAQVFDFGLYEVFEELIQSDINSQTALVLLNAQKKFDILTENNEYLYDETKEVKQEISDIKLLLKSVKELSPDEELYADSPFVFSALELTNNAQKVRELLNCNNQTVILKALEVLKRLNLLTSNDKELALKLITDENLINVVKAI